MHVKHGGESMNSNLANANLLKSLRLNHRASSLYFTRRHSTGVNSHFTSIGQTLARQIATVDTDPLYYLKPSDKVFSFQRINVQEIVNLVKGIDVGKATGLDNIPCKLLKIAADVGAPSLTCIFNQPLLTDIYPSDWKLTKVTPIFKNGSKTDLNNYRPISVIPAVTKIFEKIIYDQLYIYLNVNDPLTSCLSAFVLCTVRLLPCWRQAITGVSILTKAYAMV